LKQGHACLYLPIFEETSYGREFASLQCLGLRSDGKGIACQTYPWREQSVYWGRYSKGHHGGPIPWHTCKTSSTSPSRTHRSRTVGCLAHEDSDTMPVKAKSNRCWEILHTISIPIKKYAPHSRSAQTRTEHNHIIHVTVS